jgi:hypothetical protein
MSRRDLSQPSFVDAMVSGYGKVGGFLERIEQGFDWSAFEVLLSPIHGSAMGAPGYPPLTMFKILLLQQWHTLSDPAAEEAVRDRLSFRRFCGLPMDVETPDHASIWRFRQPVRRKDASESAGKRRIAGQTGDTSPRTPHKTPLSQPHPFAPGNARPCAKLSDRDLCISGASRSSTVGQSGGFNG